MFAATQDEDGVHRISIRRIRTITHYIEHDGSRVEIKFSSRAKAKECADCLNLYNTDYETYFDRTTGVAVDDPKTNRKIAILMNSMLDIIQDFEGIPSRYDTVVASDPNPTANGSTVST